MRVFLSDNSRYIVVVDTCGFRADMHNLLTAFFYRPNSDISDIPASLSMVPTTLLYGKKGIGKRFSIHRITKQLGIHVLSLDCYDLLDEVASKTEDAFVRWFNRANACSPCVLVLGDIDAVVKKSEVAETGQGFLRFRCFCF